MLDDNTSTSKPSINGPGIDEDSCHGIVQKNGAHIPENWQFNELQSIVHAKIWNCSFIVTTMNCNLEKESVINY